ncbi:hypothetical protein IAT38_002291 [Cryptococcus sp. DSM 104549]
MLFQLATIGVALLAAVDARPQRRQRASTEKPFTVAPVSGWSYQGCLTSGGVEALTAQYQVHAGLTSEGCTSWCQESGFTYATLDSHDRCSCDNTIRNSITVASAKSCASACESGSTGACNGAGLELWKAAPSTTNSPPTRARHVARAAVTTGTYLGCYKDSGSSRTLSGSHTSTSSNTPSSCASYCSGLGYKYGGTEYGAECWCGNSLDTSRLDTDSRCSMACSGDKSKTCGGDTRIAVYCLSGCTAASAGTYQGCYKDGGSSRTLSGTHTTSSSNTPASCSTYCSGLGYKYSGTEYSNECWCGNSLDSTKLDTDAKCSMTCTGDSSLKCGGDTRLSVYCISNCGTSTSTSSTSTSKASTSTSTTSTSTTKASTTTSSTTSTTSTAATASASNVNGAPSIPSTSGTKYLYAHHMVGNTYSYSQSTWADDISQAASAGIDGFALNYGSDSWQPARIASAYAAAAAQGSFKMFLSMDVTSLSCSSASDAANLVDTIATYASHSAQAKYQGKALVSTFSGEYCTFGQGSVSAGWTYFRSLLTAKSVSIYFVPSIFSDTSTFSSNSWMEGEFNWNSGWPMGSTALTTSSDTTYMSALGSKEYMAAVSPCFFTYYSPSSYNKDWIYRSDDWLLARRMEQIISQRASFDLAEIISWNDYGESHYIGPIRADQPNSQGWTNGMPHTAWLTVIQYYASAFKSGSYGSNNDQMVFWTRPHPKAATPSSPTCSRPTNWDYTDDLLYVWVALKSAATVTITSGSNTGTWNLAAGVSKISVSSGAGVITGKIVRSGSTVKSYTSSGSFTYTTSPTDYNYNYFVASV